MSRTHEIAITDEAGRVVRFRVQINESAATVACWEVESGNGGTISVSQLFARCVQETASQ